MINFWRRGLFLQTWHPSFEELMLYLEGELGPKADKVEAHLKSCWSCRLNREKVDRLISAFMETRNASLAGSPNFPTQALLSFETKLDKLESESGSPPIFSSLIRTRLQALFLSRSPLGLATFLVSLLLIALVLIRLSSAPPVSAKEVLSRVKQAEAQRRLQVSAPVIYEKLQLRRLSSTRQPETVTWEIWNDTRNSRFRHRVEDAGGLRFLPMSSYRRPAALGRSEEAADEGPGSSVAVKSGRAEAPLPRILAELEQVFRSNQADLGQPLSPANYEAWRRSIRQKSEEVLERKLPNGDKAMILRVSGQGPFLPNAIVHAEFMVRAGDWHPLEQRLQVQKEDGIVDYAFGEVAFDVIALNALPPSIFADLTPPLPLPLTVTSRSLAASRMPLPDLAELTAAEVEAWYALHSVQACLGRPISVVQVGLSQIEVQGVVETEERRTQILASLRGIPHVTPKIRTVAEDWVMPSSSEVSDEVSDKEKENEVSSSDPDQPGLVEAQNRKLAIEDLLEQYFTDGSCAQERDDGKRECIQQKIAELSHQAVSRSESAQEQAWALSQLAQWYPSLKQDKLRTSARRLLELMVRDHMTALKKELKQFRAQVEPVLSDVLLNAAESADGHSLTPGPSPATGARGKKSLELTPSPPLGERVAEGRVRGTLDPISQSSVGDESVASDADTKETQPIALVDFEADWAAASLHLCASVERAVTLTLGMFAETNLPVTQRKEAMKDVLSTFATVDGKFQQLEGQVATELSDSPKVMTSRAKPESE
jgi:hypothetical protein